MNRVQCVALRLAGVAAAAVFLCCSVSRIQAQATPPAPQASAQSATRTGRSSGRRQVGRGSQSVCGGAGSAAAGGDDGVGCKRSALQADAGVV